MLGLLGAGYDWLVETIIQPAAMPIIYCKL